MKLPPSQARVREREATLTEPADLPAPAGEQRFQAALDRDAAYRRAVLGACAMAFAAGTGFGTLLPVEGWFAAALRGVMSAGLAFTCVRGRHTSAEGMARNGSLAARALTALSVAMWVYVVVPPGLPLTPRASAAAGTALAIAALQAVAAKRASFVPAVVVVAAIHFTSAVSPALAGRLAQHVWLQLAAVAVEFLLLVGAGYRYALAAVLRLPTATYRVAPLSVVPRIDRAWDHPVKISAD